MNLDEVLARESIRELVARYAVGVDSGDIQAALSCFAETSTMDFLGRTYVGPQEIIEIFQSAGEDFTARAGAAPKVRHNITTHKIELTSPSTAKGRLYFMVAVGEAIDHWGRYFDTYGVVDGEWKITSRVVTVDHSISGIA